MIYDLVLELLSNDSVSEPKLRLTLSVIKARRDAGLTQAELAQRAGLSRATIGAIEQGRANPTFSTLMRIAEALDAELIVELRRENGRSE